jgi:molecular chaperone GrpE
MEARTRAAEEQVQNVQSRFNEMQREMQRQIDETRERLNRSADERTLGSKTEFVAALLPVFDNLQRSLEAARGSGSIEALLDGLERTVQGFENALSAIGVEPVKSVGELFDPEKHEAVDTVEIRGGNDTVVTRAFR